MNRSELESLKREIAEVLSRAQAKEDLDFLKVKYLGKKGILSQYLRELKNYSPEDKRLLGSLLNEIKEELEEALRKKEREILLAEEDKPLDLDLTLPGRKPKVGAFHPLSLTIKEICSLFEGIGFEVVEGPEVESDFYNFTALNIPEWHPARDMQATFYLENGALLRTHTSPMQVRAMKVRKPPLRIIAPGKVYRCDADVRHSPMFHQVEGLLVDERVTFADLKGILSYFAKGIFGEKVRLRFRPSYFPFTEPSLEMDISCVICDGKGCRVCSQTGWLEILGAGMVHPEVFKTVGYDPKQWQGFAFGLGVERIAMIRYGIDDIRLFFDNHLYFLGSFR